MKKNTIITQLGRTASRWQNNFLRSLGLKSFHEPIGGWQENCFDKDLSWSHYLNTRLSCRPSNWVHDPASTDKLSGCDLRDIIEEKEFIEVGYSSLPYITNVPCDWKLLGVVRHPKKWVYSATNNRFFYDHMSWHPITFEDYANIWVNHTKRMVKLCERIYRCEDFNTTGYAYFAQEFGIYNAEPLPENLSQKQNYKRSKEKIENDDLSWWPIVEEMANYFNYDPENKTEKILL